jgi:hypothetical protein
MTWSPIFTINNKLLTTMRAIGEAYSEFKTIPFPNTAVKKLQLADQPPPLREANHMRPSDRICLNTFEIEKHNYYNTCQVLFQSVHDGSFKLNHHTLDWLVQRIRPATERPQHPDRSDESALTSALIQFIKQQMGVMDPIILAGIFFRQAVLLRLGGDNNNLAIHLLTSAILGKAGMQHFELMGIRRYCQLNTNRYLKALGFTYAEPRLNSDADLTGWLEFFVDGVLYELHSFIQRNTTQNVTKPVLHPQYLRIIKFMERNGSISPQESHVTPSHDIQTLKLYLDNLVRLGLIETKGQGKGIFYVLT